MKNDLEFFEIFSVVFFCDSNIKPSLPNINQKSAAKTPKPRIKQMLTSANGPDKSAWNDDNEY